MSDHSRLRSAGAISYSVQICGMFSSNTIVIVTVHPWFEKKPFNIVFLNIINIRYMLYIFLFGT